MKIYLHKDCYWIWFIRVPDSWAHFHRWSFHSDQSQMPLNSISYGFESILLLIQRVASLLNWLFHDYEIHLNFFLARECFNVPLISKAFFYRSVFYFSLPFSIFEDVFWLEAPCCILNQGYHLQYRSPLDLVVSLPLLFPFPCFRSVVTQQFKVLNRSLIT